MSDRMKKAQKLVKREKIKSIAITDLTGVYVVEGTTKDHLVMAPDYCSCRDFLFNIIPTGTGKCKHLIAVDIVEQDNVEIASSDQLWINLLLKEQDVFA